METYQREVVALIRASGARLKMLADHRLVTLWREYSQRVYRCGWIEPSREEGFRFITWTNSQTAISHEMLAAQQARVRGLRGIQVRPHVVRAWGGKLVVNRRIA